MMLVRKQILPNGYFKSPLSRIEFEKHKLCVPVEVEDMVAHNTLLHQFPVSDLEVKLQVILCAVTFNRHCMPFRFLRLYRFM